MAARALPDLIARIRVDSTGVDSAMTNMIGSFGRAHLALAGLGAAIGLLVVGGKSMIETFRSFEDAQLGLNQAVTAYNSNLGKNTAAHRVWIAGTTAARATTVNLKLVTDEARLAQQKYTQAVYMYGASNVKTLAARIAVERANIRLAAAEGKAGAATRASAGHYETIAATHKRVAVSLEALQGQFDTWAKTNDRYIPNQIDAEKALALFVRAGNDARTSMHLLNDALDLGVIKNMDVSEAGRVLELVLKGNSRALRELGISTAEYQKIMKSHHTDLWKQHHLLTLIEGKLKDGRKAQDDVKQSANELNAHWITLSKKGGPVLTTALDAVVTAANSIYDGFDRIGKDDALWASISDRLVKMASWIHDYVIKPIQDAYALINGGPDSRQGAASQAAGVAGRYGYGGVANFATADTSHPKPNVPRALGGSVLPGNIYTVGERGPETLVMGARGGSVIPNSAHHGGGGNVYVTVMGSIQTERSLVLAIKEGIRRSDRAQR